MVTGGGEGSRRDDPKRGIVVVVVVVVVSWKMSSLEVKYVKTLRLTFD